jgi:hypothetical protein
MFMAFHTTRERRPILVAASLSLILVGIGLALSLV